jgi:hypothetical protein
LRWYSISTFCSKALGWPNSSTITEWSMTRFTGTSGLILRGIAAQLGDGIAHRGKIDHAGHAGEVLQQHAGRAVLDLVRAIRRVLLPVDTACTSSVETVKPPSSKRSRFSSSTFIEKGRRETSPSFSPAFFSE